VGCIIFYGDLIYDIEGRSQAKEFELSSSKHWSSCVYDLDVWKPDNDMVSDFFCPFKDDLPRHTQGDIQSSFGSCDAYPFEDTYFFYENFYPPSPPDLDGYQYMSIP